MKKWLKTTIIAAIMATFMTSVCFALEPGWMVDFSGQWYWWKGFDGYLNNEWAWLDGNRDGIAECYYFDNMNHLAVDTTTPDGYQVDKTGAWIVDGVVQTKPCDVNVKVIQFTKTSDLEPIRHLDLDFTVENTRWGRPDIMLEANDFIYFRDHIAGAKAYSTTYDWIKAYADYSDKGAYWATVIDHFAIPYDLMDNLTDSRRVFDLITAKGVRESWLLEMTLSFMARINDNVGGINFNPRYIESLDRCFQLGGTITSNTYDVWSYTHPMDEYSFLFN